MKTERIDPTAIVDINRQARSWVAAGETVMPVGIGHIVIEEDALPALAELTRALSGGGRTLMVVDDAVMRRDGQDLKALIEQTLRPSVTLDVRHLPSDTPDHSHLLTFSPSHAFHPDIDSARQLAEGLTGYSAVLAVGSGSITDVSKYARHLAVEKSGRPMAFINFPTAASVTAYTSALAVLTVDGVKRTLPAEPAEAIVCDLRTLAGAPQAMTAAGFGDVLARSVAYGDWFIASQLEMDGFSQVPSRLLECAEQAMIDRAEDVAANRLAGVRAVTEAVLLAGMAMSLVNQTAPISGWEHVISHFLDLTAAHDGREPALHGGQVGVATLVAARAYERTWGTLDLDRLTAETTDRDVADYRRRIERMFAVYDASGRMAAEVWREFEQKLTRWQRVIDTRRTFAARKRAEEYDDFLRQNVRSSSAIESALQRAGAPCDFDKLDEPIGPNSALAAINNGHLIRSRFTLGDVLEQSGWLNGENTQALI